MTTVVLTRPEAHSQRLALALSEQGFESLVMPLMTVQPIADSELAPIPDLIEGAVCIFISANAVHFGLPHIASALAERAQEGVSEIKQQLGMNDQVFVKDGDRCWFISLKEIRLFESDGNYIKVYFDNVKPMIHNSLNALDEKLDERSFFRASRKHIINLSWIKTIETWFNGGLLVELKGGEKVEVSRRQAARFKEKMSL